MTLPPLVELEQIEHEFDAFREGFWLRVRRHIAIECESLRRELGSPGSSMTNDQMREKRGALLAWEQFADYPEVVFAGIDAELRHEHEKLETQRIMEEQDGGQ